MHGIIETDSLESAYQLLSEGDPCPDIRIAFNLSKGPSAKDLSHAADQMLQVCCGYGEGVFLIDGDLWFVACDFGH